MTDSSETRTITLGGQSVTIRRMGAGDAAAVADFAATLPAHDLLFVQRDIRNPRVVAAWVNQIADGQIRSMVAEAAGTVLATTALVRDRLSWSPHVAEVRVLVGPENRGTGLGRLLAQTCIAQAVESGVEKLIVRMTPDQMSARAVFEDLGFAPEALLKDQVRDAAGETHDIVIYALNLQRWQKQHGAYGFDEVEAG